MAVQMALTNGHLDLYDIGFCAPLGSVVPAFPEHNGGRLAWIICTGADWQSADHQARTLMTRLSSTVTVPSGAVPSGAVPSGTVQSGTVQSGAAAAGA